MSILIKLLAFTAPFIFAITGSLVSRVLTALGLGFVTYAGLDSLIGNLTGAALASLGQGGEGVGYVVQASGFSEAVVIITTAFTTRVSLTALRKLSFIAT